MDEQTLDTDTVINATTKADDYDCHSMTLHLSVALEECMSLLVEDDDDVAGFQSWFLISLTREGHFLSVLHTLVHGHLQDLPLTIHFAPVALLTPSQILIEVREYSFFFLHKWMCPERSFR